MQRRDVAGVAVVCQSEPVEVAVPLTQLTMDCLATVNARRRRHMPSCKPLHLHVLLTHHPDSHALATTPPRLPDQTRKEKHVVYSILVATARWEMVYPLLQGVGSMQIKNNFGAKL